MAVTCAEFALYRFVPQPLREEVVVDYLSCAPNVIRDPCKGALLNPQKLSGINSVRRINTYLKRTVGRWQIKR